MSDHGSGPRALADPVVDITDMYVFPNPQRAGSLVLVLNVFPFAAPSALFSDAVDYRFRVRPAEITAGGDGVALKVGESEHVLSCRFGVPVAGDGGGLIQEGHLTSSTGQTVAFRANDERGGQAPGLRVFAGLRLDPFFFDGVRMAQTVITQKLAFAPVGTCTVFRQNVLSIVIEAEVATVIGADAGPLFAVVGETARTGPMTIRLERYGRPEIKNISLFPNAFDPVNRAIDIRDLYNQEDAFSLGQTYLAAYRARLNANLAFYDGLDGKTDWPLGPDGAHPLTELLLADFMVVDVSKPFAEDGYFEIERKLLNGEPHETCGGRWLDDDSMDTFLTVLVNAGNGPRVSDGVDQATVRAARAFPYLAPPEPNPPAPQAPDLDPSKK